MRGFGVDIHFQHGKLTRVTFNDAMSLDPCESQAHRQIFEYLNGQRKTFELSFELRGTPFEKAIYRALLNVPYGQTISYKALGEKAGFKNAHRAVGNAVGKNPLAIIVPCHRVIASDGSIGGFSGGLHNKRKLLELEGVL